MDKKIKKIIDKEAEEIKKKLEEYNKRLEEENEDEEADEFDKLELLQEAFDLEEIKEKLRQKIKEVYELLTPVLKVRFSHKIVRKLKEDEEFKKKIVIEFFENLEKVQSNEEKIRNLLFMLSVLEDKKQAFIGEDNPYDLD